MQFFVWYIWYFDRFIEVFPYDSIDNTSVLTEVTVHVILKFEIMLML